MTLKIDGLDGVRGLDGHIGYTPWFTMEQDRVTEFAEVTDDRQWIHIDQERAAQGPYGTTIAHGFLVLSLMPSFMPQIVDIQNISMAVNYGLDKARFPAPLPVGSRFRASLAAVEVREVKNGVQVVWECAVEVEGADRPSCVATMLNNFYA